MTNLQPKDTWEATGRWDDKLVDIWFKTQLQDGTPLGLAWSHEEAMVKMLSRFVESYKDLPVAIYQFQTKLRNELRAKSGIMRGREFVMKDLYSFHASQADLDDYYQKVTEAYQRIFDQLGLGQDTYVTFASGGAFTKFSHEFQTICDAGEDYIYLNRDKKIAINQEVLDEALTELNMDKSELEKVKTAEVGNIFNFGTEKTDQMGLHYTDTAGQRQSIWMGSYGIGVTRLMGVIAEKQSDQRGLIWPAAIAPAQVYLIGIGADAEPLYQQLSKRGIEVIYDDRDARPGEKFADADLMGVPYRVVVSQKLADGTVEFKPRTADETETLTTEQLFKKLYI
jgi:prolyl-tRNA synthetase